jgi:hypothetical protein
MNFMLDPKLNCFSLCCLQTVVQQTSIVQKFGNNRTTPSTLGGHEGKYTPSSSVPDLAQRCVCVCVCARVSEWVSERLEVSWQFRLLASVCCHIPEDCELSICAFLLLFAIFLELQETRQFDIVVITTPHYLFFLYGTLMFWASARPAYGFLLVFLNFYRQKFKTTTTLSLI